MTRVLTRIEPTFDLLFDFFPSEWDPTSCNRRERAAWFPLVPASPDCASGGALFLRLRRRDRQDNPISGIGESPTVLPPPLTTGTPSPKTSSNYVHTTTNGAAELRRPSHEPKEKNKAPLRPEGDLAAAELFSQHGEDAGTKDVAGKAGSSNTTGAIIEAELLDAELVAARLAHSKAQSEAKAAAHAAAERKRAVRELEAKVKQSTTRANQFSDTSAPQPCCSTS